MTSPSLGRLQVFYGRSRTFSVLFRLLVFGFVWTSVPLTLSTRLVSIPLSAGSMEVLGLLLVLRRMQLAYSWMLGLPPTTDFLSCFLAMISRSKRHCSFYVLVNTPNKSLNRK